MGKRGPQCTVCTHSKRAEIERTMLTETAVYTASKFQIAAATLGNHKNRCPKLGKATPNAVPGRVATGIVAPPPMPPALGVGASLEEQMRAHSLYLGKRMQWETLHGDAKAIAALAGQF